MSTVTASEVGSVGARKHLTPSESCLIVVDMQNAFCSSMGWHQRRGMDIRLCQEAVFGCRTLIDAAHEKSIPVIYTRYVYVSKYSDGGILTEYLLPEIRESGALLPGAWESEITQELAPQAEDWVIDKSRYSAFFGTRLESLLHGLGRRTLVVCGVTTSMCVESTAREAFERDYLVFVPSDATGEFTRRRQSRGLESIADGFGWVVNVAEVIRKWS